MDYKKLAYIVLLIIFVTGCLNPKVTENDSSDKIDEAITSTPKYDGKKILYVDSYHEGYAWSDGITKGVQSTLKDTGINLKIERMDTKRNAGEDFKKEAALKIQKIIQEFNPDVLVVSDDNAFKYLVMPYYKDSILPITFCGLNWDASVYGAPYSNTAGMVEVSLTLQIIDRLKQYSKGDRVGYISANVLTEKKNLEFYEKLFNLKFDKEYLVSNIEEWKDAFLKLQEEVDLIIFENNAGISDWDDSSVETFVVENIKIPIGTTNPWIMPFSLLGITKSPEEQGEWAARAALKILDGTKPSDIPIETNQKGNLMLNIKIAENIGAIFTPSMLKNAVIYGDE